jgi:hypothetical protein
VSPNLYELLGVEADASVDEIRRAYRAKARELHPDRAGPERAEQMAALNDAFRVLRDPAARLRYDGTLRGDAPLPTWVVPDEEPLAYGSVAAPRVMRGIPWLLIALVALGVFVAFAALGRGDGPGDPVDGVIMVGSCVAVPAGGLVVEADCDGPNDGTVAALVAPDQTCPSDTLVFRATGVTTRVCVAPK